MTTDKTFDTWAIVELFGHSKIAGRVTEQQVAGGTFLRVDVPGASAVPVVQIRSRRTRDLGMTPEW